MTVGGALALPPIARGDPLVCAGRAELGRAIRWAHVAEVPEIASLLKGGELVLTTFIGIGRREREHRIFVRQLADRQIAGLVVELGHAFDVLPEGLVAEAEAHQLPLIALRREVRFVEITEAIHREILNRQYTCLAYGTDVQDRLNELVLAGGSIEDLIEALAHVIKNPVLLENEHGEVLVHADVWASNARGLAAWRAAGGERGAWNDHGAASLEVPMGRNGARGHLVALPLEHPLSDLERMVLQRVVWPIALTLQRDHAQDELSLRARGNFLFDVAERRLGPETAAAIAQSFGFEPQSALIPAVIRTTGGDLAVPASRWMEIALDVSSELRSRNVPHIVGVRPAENEILVVAAPKSVSYRETLADHIAQASRVITQRRLPGTRLVVGVGASADWGEMPTAISEAADAAMAGETMEARPWHDATRPDVGRLLFSLRDNETLQAFVRRQIGPLLEYDRTHRHKLLPTLEVLCRHGGNKSRTARELFLARQVLYDRLRRINELLGTDVSDPDTLAAATLAVRAAKYIDFAQDQQTLSLARLAR
jgi:purine catabolism regulator